MDKFNAEAKCQKCGTDQIATQLIRAGQYRYPGYDGEKYERMLRTCRTCGFFWFELPLDVEVK